MYTFSKELATKLNALNQRAFTKGEVFLLAKAISETLPLMPKEEDNVKLFILNNKGLIDEITWTISNYSYISDEKRKLIEKLICDLTLWRYNVAYGKGSMLFRDDPNSVIDDISLLPNYVDTTYMCSVADIISTANYMSSMFSDFVKFIKTEVEKNTNSANSLEK